MSGTESDREAVEPRRRRRAAAVGYAIAFVAPLFTAGLYYQATRSAGVEVGFPLDDSWIHAQYSRTLVEGRPFEYIPGEPSIGSTSVLFDVVWAGVTFLTGEYVYTIHVVNTLLTSVVGVLVAALLLRFNVPPLTAGLGAGLIVTGYPFPWSSLSGMETALATCLTTAAVLAHVTWGRRRGWRPLAGPVLMALAAMARPENLVLFPLSELDRVVLRFRQGKAADRSRAGARFAARAAAFGLTLLPYFALNYSIHGSPVPNTYAAKIGRLGLLEDIQAEGVQSLGLHLKVAWDCLSSAFWFVGALDNLVLLSLAGVGLIVLFLFLPRRHRGPAGDSFLPLLVFVGGTAAAGLVTLGIFFPGQSQRYLIQWIPMILIYGVVGMHLAARAVSALLKPLAKPAYAAVIGLAVVSNAALLASWYPDQVENYVTSVKNINEMQVALGHWVDENTPEQAVIATNDIGAIAFFGRRPIVDTIGLIDPEVVRRKNLPDYAEAMIAYLQERSVSHALLFPRCHPELILDAHFHPIHRVVLEDNVICGEERMLVMEVDWDSAGRKHEGPEWLDEELDKCESYLRMKRYFQR